jgi:16S rRNA (cytidine1402-2'-O)-methyltransferase
VCGFPADEFIFLGFPPNKSGREKFFKNIADYERTVVFYESKHRINSAVKQIQKNLPQDKKVCICRELTKEFETIYRSTIEEINNKDIEEKGEFTIIIDGRF